MKKYKIPPNWLDIVLLIVMAVLSFILIIMGVKKQFPSQYAPEVTLIMALVYLFLSLRSFEFSNDGIEITYMFLFKRHISAERITSIRFVVEGSRPSLAIFLDGQGAKTDKHLFFKAIFHPRTIIRSNVWEDDVEDHLKNLSTLYNNVRLGDSYITWKMNKLRQQLKK